MKTSKIYKYLHDNNSHYVGQLDNAIEYCEHLLKGIPAEFPNYTLHDIEHSKRVADYMADFLNCVGFDKYSHLHLYIVLLSALFHDTGMVVSKDEIEKIKNNCSVEMDEVKRNEYVQNYFRKEHARRAATKIKDAEEKGFFLAEDGNGIIGDLCKICEAHNESVDWIDKEIVGVRTLGDEQYNAKQIAMLLRFGDNLDIDNRRAPDHLAKALGIEGFSAGEWLRHLSITNYQKVFQNEGICSVCFEGVCNDVQEYATLLEFFEWFGKEISDANKFFLKFDKPYSISVCEKIENKIDTPDFESQLFEFTIEYSNIVTLLMGERIYGNRKAGIRELIQNSIDAVLVYADRIEKKRKGRYTPWIDIEVDTKNDMFSIQDNGIGMDDNIINNYFFNIGKSYYNSEEYKKNRNEYNAIGQYGIGFLACFMLADKVRLDTKTADGSNICLEFSKNCKYVMRMKNTGEFCDFVDGHGTRISMKASDIIGDIFKDKEDLKAYLMELLLVDSYGYRLCLSYDGEEEEIKPDASIVRKHIIENDSIKLSFDLTDSPTAITDLEGLGDYANIYILVDEHGFEGELRFFELKDMLKSVSDIDGEYKDDSPSINRALRYMPELFMQDDPDNYANSLLINHIYKNYEMKYSILSYIEENETLIGFRELADERGIEEAYSAYRRDIKNILIINLSENDISTEILKEMVDYSLEKVGNSDTVYNIEDFEKYFFLAEVCDNAFYQDGFAYCLRSNVEFSENENGLKLYKHGIRVNDEINLPFLIEGMKISALTVDVNNNDYVLNVSRDEFEEECKEKMCLEILKLILKKISEESNNDEFMEDDERQVLSDLVENIDKICEKIRLA